MFVIVIIASFFILPLAAQRRDFGRLLGIAVGLQAVKYFLVYIILPLKGVVDSPLLSIFVALAMLPELAVGKDFVTRTFGEWVLAVILGSMWNLLPAYMISWWMFEEDSSRGGAAGNKEIAGSTE